MKFHIDEKTQTATLISYSGDDKKLVIPDNYQGITVTKIHYAPFLYNINAKNIKEIVLPNTIVSIGSAAFANLTSLEKINLPNSIEEIEQSVFRNCVSLQQIELPENLQEIKQLTFCDCKSLTEITIPKSVQKMLSQSFANCEELEKVIYLNDDVKIMKNTFINSNKIEEISFDLLNKIPLEQIAIIIVNKINKSTITEEIVNLIKQKPRLRKELLFSNDAKTISFVLELGVKFDIVLIDECIRYYIEKEETILIAQFLEYKNKKFSKKEIEDFEENKLLVEIGLELPTIKQLTAKWKIGYDKDKNIKIYGYKGNNTHEIIPEKTISGQKIVSVIGRENVLGTITHLTINAQLVNLEERVFALNSTIEEIVLPNSITTIKQGVFMECSKLKKINIPTSIKSLDDAELMFYRCKSLESIEIPDQIKSIPLSMFFECHNLEHVKLPKNLVRIEDAAFKGCIRLADEDGFVILNSVLFDILKDEIILEIPNGVKEISQEAFNLYSSCVEEVVIPNSVEKIGKYAFINCDDLCKVTLNHYIKDIHYTSFNYSRKLADKNGFTIINDILVSYCFINAPIDNMFGNFRERNDIPSLEIPQGVKFITDGVFDKYTILKLFLPKSLEYIAPKTLEHIKKKVFNIIIPSIIGLDKQVVKYLKEPRKDVKIMKV